MAKTREQNENKMENKPQHIRRARMDGYLKDRWVTRRIGSTVNDGMSGAIS